MSKSKCSKQKRPMIRDVIRPDNCFGVTRFFAFSYGLTTTICISHDLFFFLKTLKIPPIFHPNCCCLLPRFRHILIRTCRCLTPRCFLPIFASSRMSNWCWQGTFLDVSLWQNNHNSLLLQYLTTFLRFSRYFKYKLQILLSQGLSGLCH